MTSIKCRYRIPHCLYNNRNKRLYHNECWWCDDEYGCDIGEYKRPDECDPCLVNPTCAHCAFLNGEFETTVKRYSYESGDLKVGNKTYYENEIEYLEIDGRVLVKE